MNIRPLRQEHLEDLEDSYSGGNLQCGIPTLVCGVNFGAERQK